MNKNILFKILKSGGYGLLSRIIVSLSQIIFIPLMIQVYGQEKFGVLATILSLNAFVALSNFGISKAMQNKISCLNVVNDDLRVSEILSDSLFVVIKLSLVVLAVIAFIGLIVFIKVAESVFYLQMGIAFLFSAFCLLLVSFFYDFYRGCQNPEKANKLAMIMSIVMVIITYIALHMKLSMFQLYLLVYCIPQFFLILFMMFLSEESKRVIWARFSSVKNKSVISGTSKLFFILTVIQFFGFGADTFIISAVLGASAAAEYNVAFRFYTLVIFGFSVFSSAIWPFFAKYNSEKKFVLMNDIAKKGVKLSLMYGMLSLLFITFIAPIIVDDILNVKIITDPTIYFLLGAQAALVINTSMVIPMLNAIEKLKEQVYLGFLSVILNVTLTILFVKFLGISGAPLATILSHLLFGVIPLNYILFKSLKKDISNLETS